MGCVNSHQSQPTWDPIQNGFEKKHSHWLVFLRFREIIPAPGLEAVWVWTISVVNKSLDCVFVIANALGKGGKKDDIYHIDQNQRGSVSMEGSWARIYLSS